MQEDGNLKIRRIIVKRSDTASTVKSKIVAAFGQKLEYLYCECVSCGSRLIESPNQAMNGHDAVERRGCLYMYKKPQVYIS